MRLHPQMGQLIGRSQLCNNTGPSGPDLLKFGMPTKHCCSRHHMISACSKATYAKQTARLLLVSIENLDAKDMTLVGNPHFSTVHAPNNGGHSSCQSSSGYSTCVSAHGTPPAAVLVPYRTHMQRCTLPAQMLCCRAISVFH